MAVSVADLLLTLRRPEALAQKAHGFAKQRFSIKAIAEQTCRLYDQLVLRGSERDLRKRTA